MGQDKRKAMEYFRSAARQDLRFAQAMIGVLYAEGFMRGVDPVSLLLRQLNVRMSGTQKGCASKYWRYLKPQELEAARQLPKYVPSE